MKLITTNRKAYHDYQVDYTIEAGLVLTGDEVKSLRANLVNLTGSFATIHQGELYLLNCYIGVYSHAYMKTEDHSRRTRKLLVHRKELDRLAGEIARKGMTLVPLKLYFNEKSCIKVEIGIARHKKSAEKKSELRERDIRRETERDIKGLR
jgi:SsrA-binding protein